MYQKSFGNLTLTVDFAAGCVTSLRIGERELCCDRLPIFRARLRDRGEAVVIDAFAAKSVAVTDNSAVYSDFDAAPDVRVTVTLSGENRAEWRIFVDNPTKFVTEWVDFPTLSLPKLEKNGGIGKILYPYNEGALVDDLDRRQRSWFPSVAPEYPSHGSYPMFPHMVHSQFMCYLFDGAGLYVGAHDAKRAPKAVDFMAADNGIELRFRTFVGGGNAAFDFVWQAFEGEWQDGAEIYRQWFEENLPDNVKKIAENPAIPDWYSDTPLVISYPVRGVHDMDKMDPNALFPYCNALPLIDEIAERTGSKILVLLMHWEGTAPWAPPYVWPPYGGEKPFLDFLDELHKKGNLLGVYCSGFGFTRQSNLVAEYNNEEKIEKNGYMKAFCAAPDGEVKISRICTGQRSGYDICVGSELGREILNDAYKPLFESHIDYAQILDQNHGGAQYFCYSADHGHPPVPGDWMTATMRTLLDGWNEMAGKTLFGCESSAAEPFIGNLLFSDNRFELNWHIGEPVPLYAFLYHEYLRGFQGNQVSCGLTNGKDSMRARMAYSFAAGDCMTLVLTPTGELFTNWGNHDFSILPDKELALTFAANMETFGRTVKPFLTRGRMIKPLPYTCETVAFPTFSGCDYHAPAAYSTAWE
ncbi:MAG: hypothetical protein E7632_07850, partial [Ruminococcaceae bacterium]|nr:hypothetical protein [Oscillospiraceae bacterium]